MREGPGGPGRRPTFARSRLDGLTDRAKALGAKGLAWFRVAEGEGEVALDSPLDRFLPTTSGPDCSPPPRPSPATWSWSSPTSTAWPARCSAAPGRARRPPGGRGPARYVWVVDFPLFDGVDGEGTRSRPTTPSPCPTPTTSTCLESDPAAVRSQAYDLVLNGWELGSGSVRIHRPDIQRAGLRRCSASPTRRPQSRFGFLLGAFRYGAPPHAGFAFGIDRLVAIFSGEENIREVIAFPKTQSGADPLTGAPKPLSPRRPGRPGAAGRRPAWVGPAPGGTGPMSRRTSSTTRRSAGWPTGPPWPPGCGPAPSTRWSVSATWWPRARPCGSWSRRTAWVR